MSESPLCPSHDVGIHTFFCVYSPEPTFTLAQVKEIIEGIAVRVEAVGQSTVSGRINGLVWLNQAAKIVRETAE